MELNQEKLEAFKSIVLKSGAHNSFEEGVCAMEAVAWLAGEKHADRPECACPALISFVQRLNDRWQEDERQLLKPYLLRLIGTKDKNTKARAELIVFRSITRILPIALDAAKLTDLSEKIRKLEVGNWAEAQALCREARDAARMARENSYKKAADADAAAYAAVAAYAYAAADAAAAAAVAADAAASVAAYVAAYAAVAADVAADAAAKPSVAYLAQTRKEARHKVIDATLAILDEAIELKATTTN